MVQRTVWVDDAGWLHGTTAGGLEVLNKPIPEATKQPFISPRLQIAHSNAGPTPAKWWNLIAYWTRTDISGEAHFQVSLEGILVQAMPVIRRADCNYKVNSFGWDSKTNRPYGAVSFETGDNGSASLPTTPWTIGQLDALGQAMAAISLKYGIPCTSVPVWNGAGIDYHSKFPEWSTAVGKTCPGAARIRQMDFLRRYVADLKAA